MPFEFNKAFLNFANDANEQIRITTANCLHEAFIEAGDEEDTSVLRETFHELL